MCILFFLMYIRLMIGPLCWGMDGQYGVWCPMRRKGGFKMQGFPLCVLLVFRPIITCHICVGSNFFDGNVMSGILDGR